MNLIPNTLETYKYSYEKANPRTVTMSVVATPRKTLNSNEEADVAKDINSHKNLGIVHKLLGIHFKINGDTSHTGKLLTKKSKSKMTNTNLPKGGPKQASTISNVYLSTTASYSALTANLTPEDTNSLDVQLINKIKQHFGLAPTDSAIALIRAAKTFGGGLTSCFQIGSKK